MNTCGGQAHSSLGSSLLRSVDYTINVSRCALPRNPFYLNDFPSLMRARAVFCIAYLRRTRKE